MAFLMLSEFFTICVTYEIIVTFMIRLIVIRFVSKDLKSLSKVNNKMLHTSKELVSRIVCLAKCYFGTIIAIK